MAVLPHFPVRSQTVPDMEEERLQHPEVYNEGAHSATNRLMYEVPRIGVDGKMCGYTTCPVGVDGPDP